MKSEMYITRVGGNKEVIPIKEKTIRFHPDPRSTVVVVSYIFDTPVTVNAGDVLTYIQERPD